MGDILGRYGVEIAFAQSKVVNRIQNVGLSHTIVTDKTIDLAVECKIPGFNIPIIYE